MAEFTKRKTKAKQGKRKEILVRYTEHRISFIHKFGFHTFSKLKFLESANKRANFSQSTQTFDSSKKYAPASVKFSNQEKEGHRTKNNVSEFRKRKTKPKQGKIKEILVRQRKEAKVDRSAGIEISRNSGGSWKA